ncbi:4Fe-4S binding protein [Chloroflexota bacterium]
MEPSGKLSTTFVGVKMRSPLGIGTIYMPMGRDCTPEVHAKVLMKHVEAGAGYVATHFEYAAGDELKPAVPLPKSLGYRWRKVEGMNGLELFKSIKAASSEEGLGFDYRRRILEILKREVPERVAIITSARFSGSPEADVLTAKKMEEIGVDLIEFTLSCNYFLCTTGSVEKYLEKAENFVKLVLEEATAVVKAVHIPIGIKLTPGEIGYPRMLFLVRCLRDAGVKYIQVSNVGAAIAPPDIYNRGKSHFAYADEYPFSGVSGAPLRLECYKDVAAIRKFVPGIEIAAAGGFTKPEHAVEVMMLGANQVQFVTGLFFYGRKLLKRTTQFLETFLEEQGYKNIGELVGLGLGHIRSADEVALMETIAEVDQTKCTGCGICTDHICIAMKEKKNGNAQVNHDLCFGCGLCVETCPSQAIRLLLR